MSKNVPAEVFHVGHFIKDELKERGWTRYELVTRLGGDTNVDTLALELLLDAPIKGLLLGDSLANDLARVFGTSSELWLNLDKAWQDAQHK